MSAETPSPGVGRKATRTLGFIVAGLAVLLIGYIVGRSAPESGIHADAQFYAFVTIWVVLGVFGGGVVIDVLGAAWRAWKGT